jgi:HK97 gp10 family phage protein
MSEEVTVTGLNELSAKLRELTPNLVKRALIDSLRQSGEVFRDALEEYAPVGPPPDPHSGQLAESMKIVVKLDILKDQGIARIGPTQDAFWGRFSEFGTVHEAAKPWMRPAYDAVKNDALDKFVATMKSHLPELTK